MLLDQLYLHQDLCDPRAVMLLQEIELIEKHCRPVRLIGNLEGAQLYISGWLAVHLGEAKCIGRIPKLFLPVLDAEARQEGVEVLRAVEVSEGLAEARVEDPIERGRIFRRGHRDR